MGRGALSGLGAAAALVAGLAHGQAAPRWYVQVDNDVFLGTDRWYTSGVRVSRVAVAGGYEWEASLLQEIYTPDPVHLREIDRAPTSRLLLALARHERGEGSLRTLEAALGVRGPSAQGERAADVVHHLVPARDVDWSRQQGDRVDAQLTYAHSRDLGPLRAHGGVVLGTQIGLAHLGASYGFGAATDSPLLRFAPTPPWDGAATGWGGFVGVSARYVFRNEMLGQPYRPWMAAIEQRNAVGRATAGLSWRAPWGTVAFAVALDSREFEGQAEPHRFGSLSLHVPF